MITRVNKLALHSQVIARTGLPIPHPHSHLILLSVFLVIFGFPSAHHKVSNRRVQIQGTLNT